MEGQSSSGNSQYQYQATQWSRLVRRNTLAAAVPGSPPPLPPSIAVTSQLPPHLDLIPILLPHQSSFHQAQLAQYNRLITAGRTSRLQSSPLPPLLSPQHIQAVPGQRSSSGGSTPARTDDSTGRGGHGNKEARIPSKGERALVTDKDKTATMPGKKAELNQLPIRPYAHHHNTNFSQQSSSVPSTPHQHARKFSYESREPSPNASNNHSPRSAYSESNMPLPPKPHPAKRGGCRYETAMANTRRRIPYSVGDKKLDKLDRSTIKSKLSDDDESKVSADMQKKYEALLPTLKSDKNRETLVQKLEDLFNGKWPGHNIRVHVFGSSGNMLATDDSDVDICITTEWKEMEHVCMVAELLANSGMEKVICVPNAKVPIVKVWDPELNLACDMNVNNPLALENTRMIRTYLQIDPRVRPLAMIVKDWTKKRILNDAAFGCTLSSYTWICMIIFFLQTRSPPILPALHQRPHNKLPSTHGVESAFADDLEALSGFGSPNKDTLGELLFQFFRFYGHEFDLDNGVVSVRHGRQLTKAEKKWNTGFGNRLCVEEPFNVGRNLGNTADDISFRGVHMELRRAFDLISEGKLEECCEQYVFPPEEKQTNTFQRPTQKPKPVLRSSSQSSRGGGRGGGHRGGGRHNQHSRNGNSNRRASSGAFDHHGGFIPGLPSNMSQQEAWLQRQAQTQLHNDLFATYSVLQAQENSLRLQLYAQGLQNQAYAQSQGQGHGQVNGAPSKQHATNRNRTSSFDQPPLTAPIRPDMYFYPLHYPATPGMYGYQTPTTNPSSPSLSSAVPEMRRSIHRSTVTNGTSQGGQSNSALRSQSQPASRSGQLPVSVNGNGMPHAGLGIYQHMRPVNGNSVPSFMPEENSEPALELSHGCSLPASEDPTPKEYVGYYVNDPARFWRRQAIAPVPIPTFGDLGQSRASSRRLSAEQLPQSILDRLKRPSRSPSPLGHDRSLSTGAPLALYQNGVSNTSLRALNNQTPVIVNGSNPVPLSIPNWQASISDGSISEDRSSDIFVGSMDSLSQASRTGSDEFGDEDLSGQVTPRDTRQEPRIEPPMVVNGSTPLKSDSGSTSSMASSNEHVQQPSNPSLGLLPIEADGQLRLSPSSRNKFSRQNGGVSPLDIGLGQDFTRDDLAHLSPVYETRTPSPTANLKFEPVQKKSNGALPRVSQKPEPSNGISPIQAPAISKLNGHTRDSKSEGSPGNWQKIQKSKKKPTSSDMKSVGDGLLHAEKLPVHVNERKGG